MILDIKHANKMAQEQREGGGGGKEKGTRKDAEDCAALKNTAA